MIRLIALDLDGTVLDSQGDVPDANRAAIAGAIAAGVEVAIATGRRYEFARPILERLPAPLTLILSNGAIVKASDGQTMMRRLLPSAAARAVLGRAREHRAGAALIFDRAMAGQVIFEAIDWEDRRQRLFVNANRSFVSEHSPLEDALTEDPVQLMFTGRCTPMRELFDGLQQAAVQAVAGGEYSVALTEYRAPRLLARGCRAGRMLQGICARRVGRAAGAVVERCHGDWRQPE